MKQVPMPRGLVLGVFALGACEPIPFGLCLHDDLGNLIVFLGPLQISTPGNLTCCTEVWDIKRICEMGKSWEHVS